MSASKHRIIVSCVLLLLAAGCGGGGHKPPTASDPAQARETLASTLDAWKAGSKSEDLAKHQPVVYAQDEDWSGGYKLKQYSLNDTGESFGSNVRFQVDLKLDAKDGDSVEKTVRYIVATNPVRSVTRDDRGE